MSESDQVISKRHLAWLKKIAASLANADRPAFKKIYHIEVDGQIYTLAAGGYYFVCILGKAAGSEEVPSDMADKIAAILRDKRIGAVVKVRTLRGWAGPADWDNKHLGCSNCNGEPTIECNYCQNGVRTIACHHCAQTHACPCGECDGKGNLQCKKIQSHGWLNSIMLSRQLVAQAIDGITAGEITIMDGAKTDPVYFDKDNIRAVVMPINQELVTEDEIKSADRFQFGRRVKE